MHTDIIVFDPTFWGDILCQLEVFYFEHVFPELVYPRLKYGGLRWNSNEIGFPRMEFQMPIHLYIILHSL